MSRPVGIALLIVLILFSCATPPPDPADDAGTEPVEAAGPTADPPSAPPSDPPVITEDPPAETPAPAPAGVEHSPMPESAEPAEPVLTSGTAEAILEEMLPDFDLPTPEILPLPEIVPDETEADTETDAEEPAPERIAEGKAESTGTDSPGPGPAEPEAPAAPIPVSPPMPPSVSVVPQTTPRQTPPTGAPQPAETPSASASPAAVPPVPAPAPIPAPVPQSQPGLSSSERSAPKVSAVVPAPRLVPEPSPAAAAAPASEAVRRIYGRPGDDIDVNFPGSGWLFLGIDGGERGIEFLRRSSAPDSTSFLFRARDLGDYRISFQRQDMVAGEILEERIEVSILPPEEFTRAIAAAGSRVPGETAPQDAGAPAAGAAGTTADGPATAAAAGRSTGRGDAKERLREEAERLFRSGRYSEAIERYLALGGQDPDVIERIAEAYRLSGNEAEAVPYWERNLEADGEWADRAMASLYSAAIRRQDRSSFDRYLPSVLQGLGTVPVDDLILSGARYREEDGDVPGAIDLYREYLERGDGSGDPGEAWYRLGRLFESEGPSRDLKRALQAYRTVHDRYPVSAFWRPARERLQYLNRHIFDLR